MALGAWFTDRIGLHAVFGAFAGRGDAARRGRARSDRRIQPHRPLLLRSSSPTRLNTKIALLNTGVLWLMCGVVLSPQ
jgi:hypothetical protein